MDNAKLRALHYINICWACLILFFFAYKLFHILMPVISKNILDYLLWVGIFSAAAIIGLTINKLVIRKNLGEAEKYYDMAMEIKLTIGLISTTVFVAYIFWKFNL